jgi:cell wall-active antibiotic response 4TMS protein YvqF
MSVPPPIPTPPGAPQVTLMRALTGPLVLTTLGLLLSMDHLGGVSFSRSWPALLIVFGICKIAEFAAIRPGGRL